MILDVYEETLLVCSLQSHDKKHYLERNKKYQTVKINNYQWYNTLFTKRNLVVKLCGKQKYRFVFFETVIDQAKFAG